MKLSTKINTIRTIKIGFDITIIALSLFLIYFIYLGVREMSASLPKSKLGIMLAQVVPNKISSSNDFVIKAKNSDAVVTTYIDSYKIAFNVKNSTNAKIPIIFKIVFLLALNLNLFFLIFVFFQASRILSSIIRGIRNEKENLHHFIFNKRNIKRFQYISYGFIAMPLFELIIYFSDSIFLKKYFLIEGFTIEPIIGLSSISWDYIFIGLLFISLIEVIRRGMSIQEENDLTV